MSECSVTSQTEFCTVIDNLLTPNQQDRLWNYFQMPTFMAVGEMGLRGHWLLEDREVLRGPTVGWGHKFDFQYPTRSALDDVMESVVQSAPSFAASVGKHGHDWDIFSAFTTMYAAGQGLVWHRDSEDNTGSWVYYAHPEWNIEWGGELLLAHDRDIPREYGVYFHKLRPTLENPSPPAFQAHLDNRDASELLMARGIGSYVAPKPNRLVVIKGGTPHAIAKVRPSAGRHLRASVGGFFKRKSVDLAGSVSPYPI